ncbi:MAG TPA: hypothetical protein VLF09_00725 [Cellvibrio sp.]|nr:hypothetical protein [Cellvibrio sp.]
MISSMENHSGKDLTTEESRSMSRTMTNDYMPTDFFSRQALELTFRLLRNNHPLLAHAVKNAMDSTAPIPYEDLHSTFTGEMFLNVEVLNSLKAHTIGKIVSVLTDIGEQALKQHDLPPSHMTLMRTLIEDWVQLTEWVLAHTAADQNDRTAYH